VIKGIITNKNSNGSILLLTISDGVTIALVIITTCTTMVIIGKGGGINFKLVPPIVGLVGLVVTTNYSPWCSSLKVVAVAPIAFVLVPISKYTKVGGIYLKFGKVV
jgi:hypothetical protein